MVEARNNGRQQPTVVVPEKIQTTKDDVAHLLHLFKEPVAQRHWTNLYAVLTRPELDARKSSGEYAEAANPLESLAEIFNDYEDFEPQNLMVKYVTLAAHAPPVKKFPYAASMPEWTYLATFTHDVDPTNRSRSSIIRGPDWIKSTWTEVQKYLHQVYFCNLTVIYFSFLNN
jgi:hypothetical protein